MRGYRDAQARQLFPGYRGLPGHDFYYRWRNSRTVPPKSSPSDHPRFRPDQHVSLGILVEQLLSLFLKNSFDLVLTDFAMPIMDGWSLTQCIKQRPPNTPVVLMMGTDRETVSKKEKSAPFDSVIFKPFLVNDFQSTVVAI